MQEINEKLLALTIIANFGSGFYKSLSNLPDSVKERVHRNINVLNEKFSCSYLKKNLSCKDLLILKDTILDQRNSIVETKEVLEFKNPVHDWVTSDHSSECMTSHARAIVERIANHASQGKRL